VIAIMTIDFEASCLPRHGRSFPIEVGVSDLAGRTQAWLIRPHPVWHGWEWTAEAEGLHGLSRRQVEREGLPAAVVLQNLAAAVRGHAVVADSDLDARWLRTLALAAGAVETFHVGHVSGLLDAWQVTPERAADAMRAADRMTCERHRAAADARWLALVLEGLSPDGLFYQGAAMRYSEPVRVAA
jgi:hypothetical protein